MDVSAEAIIKEIIDPLMMDGLAAPHPTVEIRRLATNAILVDFGLPDVIYVLSVEERLLS